MSKEGDGCINSVWMSKESAGDDTLVCNEFERDNCNFESEKK